MRKQKNRIQGQFKQFVDETSPEQAAEIQKNWRKRAKQQKDKLFTRILVIATIIVALVFVVTLNLFIDNKKQHIILDQDKEGYILVQTTFPHLKVLLDKQIQTYETKMIRSAGIVYPELVSWIEANVPSNYKVLFIPNQNSGVTILGMALAYYLSTSNGGSLDIIIETEAYRQHLAKNAQQMKNFKDQKIVLNYFNNKNQIKNDYHLLILQNNDILEQISLTRFQKIVEIKKKRWDNASIRNYMKSYSKYEINKGRFNSQALALGQFKSYSLTQLRESIREQYKIILILIKPQSNINLCPQQNQIFKLSSEKRNLVEFFRNKTLASKEQVFYCLDDIHTQKSISQLNNIRDFFIGGSKAIQTIKQEKFPYSSSIKHTYILNLSDFNKFKTKLKGEILILINSSQQDTQIQNFVSNSAVKMISPFNNNGCLFPGLVLPYRNIIPFHPFFLKLTKN